MRTLGTVIAFVFVSLATVTGCGSSNAKKVPPAGDAGDENSDTGGASAGGSSSGGSSQSSTCHTIAIDSVTPAAAALGSKVTIEGTGFACLHYLAFRTDQDLYTFSASDYTVTGDTQI